MIVPMKPASNVICNPDVMARWLGITPDHVDDPLLGTMHAGGMRTIRAKRESDSARFAGYVATTFACDCVGVLVVEPQANVTYSACQP
jgi:hypothetical protein